MKIARQLASVSEIVVRNPRQARYLLSFAKSIGKNPVDLRQPWLAFDVIEWLGKKVRPEWSVYEYGGGGSSIYFADRVNRLRVAESDESWADAIRQAFGSSSDAEVAYISLSDGGDEYVRSIDRYETGGWDLVLVDGRHRVRCVEHAAEHVKPGGWMILDDSTRPEYAAAFEMLRSWELTTISGLAPGKPVPGTTSIWRCPD